MRDKRFDLNVKDKKIKRKLCKEMKIALLIKLITF